MAQGVSNFAARPRPMVVLTYVAPGLAESALFGSDHEQLGESGGGGREEGYIAAALASIDRRLIFSSDCQDAFARPTQLVDRNARFVHGPVDHQRNIFGPVERKREHRRVQQHRRVLVLMILIRPALGAMKLWSLY